MPFPVQSHPFRPPPSNHLHLWEMMDLCVTLTLLLTQYHVDIFSTLVTRVATF